MYKVEDYQPKVMVFTVETNAVPQSLGKFKSDEKARVFMEENLLAAKTKYTAERYMDQVEIEILRDRYTEELEDILPGLREADLKKTRELKIAKQNRKDAREMVNASLNRIQQMADEVNGGVARVELGLARTWKLIYNGKKYVYTYMDEEIKLAGVHDVSGYEINDLTGNSKKNKTFFKKLNQTING